MPLYDQRQQPSYKQRDADGGFGSPMDSKVTADGAFLVLAQFRLVLLACNLAMAELSLTLISPTACRPFCTIVCASNRLGSDSQVHAGL